MFSETNPCLSSSVLFAHPFEQRVLKPFSSNVTALTNFMENSPSWEADSCWASQIPPSFYGTRKIQYRVHKIPPPVPILIHTNPIHTRQTYFHKIHFNIVFQSKPSSF
jgi:hypothetical protein